MAQSPFAQELIALAKSNYLFVFRFGFFGSMKDGTQGITLSKCRIQATPQPMKSLRRAILSS